MRRGTPAPEATGGGIGPPHDGRPARATITPMDLDDASLTCRDCGLPVRRITPDRWMHRKGGAVAACDLDSDHPAVPDLAGRVPVCADCGAALAFGVSGRLEHREAPSDGHEPAPALAG